MKQSRVILELGGWLSKKLDNSAFTVLCDHIPVTGQEPALYIGGKLPGSGRGSRIKEVDIAVVNRSTETVQLIVEVDPDTTPAHILGAIGAAFIADVYVPSRKHSSEVDHRIKDCIFIYATVLPVNPKSAKRCQLQLIEATANRKMISVKSGGAIRRVHLCHAVDENQLLETCRTLICREFRPCRP